MKKSIIENSKSSDSIQSPDSIHDLKSDSFDKFKNLIISSDSNANSNSERMPCPSCNSNYKLYCPKCVVPINHIPPVVTLPKLMTVYKHPLETQGKTTSVHAKLLSPQVDYSIVDLEHYKPEYDPSRTLLLFPSVDAVGIDEISPDSFDRILVVDGTWRQAKAMTNHLSSVYTRHVKIQNHNTLFWRFQKYSNEYLATIEAIYWFYFEYHQKWLMHDLYTGQYDDLLFYFKIQYDHIQEFYRNRPHKKFTQRKLDSNTYIVYED